MIIKELQAMDLIGYKVGVRERRNESELQRCKFHM